MVIHLTQVVYNDRFNNEEGSYLTSTSVNEWEFARAKHYNNQPKKQKFNLFKKFRFFTLKSSLKLFRFLE